MADWHFARAGCWPELVGAHDRFVEDYNAQAHWAHRERNDGRRSPSEVLGFVSGVRHRQEELARAFFSARFVRVLDAFGYATFRRWRVYGEEGLAGREAALWLAAESLTLEHGGEPLSRYEVRVEPNTGRLRAVGRPRLFEASHALPQPRLFGLDSLGEAGWLKALRLGDYAPRRPASPRGLQQSPLSVPRGLGLSLRALVRLALTWGCRRVYGEVCSEKPRSSRMDGSARFTIVESRTIMKSPRQKTRSASQRTRRPVSSGALTRLEPAGR
jgi:hypothetical protein